MANVNQGVRSGNAFGRLSNVDYSQIDTSGVSLKPGYLLRMRNRFYLVEAAEAMSVDLFFTDTVNFGATIDAGGVGEATLPVGTHSQALSKYGLTSIAAYYDVTSTAAAADRYGNILKPDFDSGYIEFGDLEPFKGNLYQLCPTLPNQPKFIDLDDANGGPVWHSRTAYDTSTYSATAGDGFEPVGFTVGTTDVNRALTQVGTVSGKLSIKHPAGVPTHVLDEAPEGSSGPTPHSANASGSLEGLSGFIDGQMSPCEQPNWDYSLWIEHGENNLPKFKLVNDSDEFLLDGRIRLVGWKYRIIELTSEQLQTFKQRSGGRLTFKIINTAGLPVAGSMLADYFPK